MSVKDFEKGMVAGADPFEKKYDDLKNKYQQLKVDNEELKEYMNRIFGIMNSEYDEITKMIKREKQQLEEAGIRFMDYDIEETFHVFDSLYDNYEEACYFLGEIFYNGYGDIEKDLKKCADSYLKGWHLSDGNSLCKIKLAEYFPTLLPDGVKQTVIFESAVEWLEDVATKKFNAAVYEYELGNMYENGLGCDIDLEKAFEFYKSAADRKYFKAIYKVAQCYSEGIGVEKMSDTAKIYLDEYNQMINKK